MDDEQAHLAAIQQRPEDLAPRAAYAAWLEERGDERSELVRLALSILVMDPDDLQRPWAEQRYSAMGLRQDADWLAAVTGLNTEIDPCVRRWHASGRERLLLTENRLHTEIQNTECDVWKRLLDLIEDAAADGRGELSIYDAARSPRDWNQLVTLPSSIARLTSLEVLRFYGSRISRLPPEIGELTSLREFVPYTSHHLHWLPYEITRCARLRDSTISTRALYGNYKFRPHFPCLRAPAPDGVPDDAEVGPAPIAWVRLCSVCNRPFQDRRAHRVWITLRVASDVVPLLVNACSAKCVQRLPQPAADYPPSPHRGGPDVPQTPTRFSPC